MGEDANSYLVDMHYCYSLCQHILTQQVLTKLSLVCVAFAQERGRKRRQNMENLRGLIVGMDQRGFFDSIGTLPGGKASSNS